MKFRRTPPAPVLDPEWLVIGLGNPGPEYRGTRHNVGFDLIDILCERCGVKLKQSKHRSIFAPATISSTPVLLIKPLTFMNLSGQSAAAWAKAYKIPPSRVIVIADDIHLPVGALRLREKGSPGGHNGHKSLIASLGTQEYPRFKVGVGEPAAPQIEHVLGRFGPDERTDVNAALVAGANAIEALISTGPESAQEVVTKYNHGRPSHSPEADED